MQVICFCLISDLLNGSKSPVIPSPPPPSANSLFDHTFLTPFAGADKQQNIEFGTVGQKPNNTNNNPFVTALINNAASLEKNRNSRKYWTHNNLRIGWGGPVEQIRWVFDDNKSIIFHISPLKRMLWGDSNEYPQHMFLWRTDKNYPSVIIKDPPYLFDDNKRIIFHISPLKHNLQLSSHTHLISIHVNPSWWTWGRFGFHFREIEVCIRETIRRHF